ncbi:MAG: MarR family winged helix-turn-helix transcriptional regulator [Alphaproteobacteria bacterium]|nr:MarR family winged helix-turn-helix transcriptional regulator [Alphaproteobacteria bacterium]MBU2379393.1 MarR family winged helix-turn-helix transcriptional regulator [Alphaproteobacteria bacterium]
MRGLGDYRRGVCFQLLVTFDAARDPARPETLFTIAAVIAAMGTMGVKDRRAVSELIVRLREDGYVTTERAAHDRRVVELRATDKAREADREWIEVLHRPMTILAPDEARFRPGAQRDPTYQWAYRATALATLPHAGAVMAGHPEADYFVRQTQGARIMMTLMQAVRGRPDLRTDPGFYSWAAERCGVSAQHIRKVMAGAETRGWIAVSGGKGAIIEVSPALDAGVRRWSAACFSLIDLNNRHAWALLSEAGPEAASVAGF